MNAAQMLFFCLLCLLYKTLSIWFQLQYFLMVSLCLSKSPCNITPTFLILIQAFSNSKLCYRHRLAVFSLIQPNMHLVSPEARYLAVLLVFFVGRFSPWAHLISFLNNSVVQDWINSSFKFQVHFCSITSQRIYNHFSYSIFVLPFIKQYFTTDTLLKHPLPEPSRMLGSLHTRKTSLLSVFSNKLLTRECLQRYLAVCVAVTHSHVCTGGWPLAEKCSVS